jgi:recombination associated protein RdgC
MFKNLQVYRLPANYSLTAAALIEMLTPQVFAPCSSNEVMRQGWVPPRADGPLVYSINKQLILNLRKQTKVLPGSVVAARVKEMAAELEEAQGFAPGKKATKELKERAFDELLPKAFSKDTHTSVWIDPVNGWLVVDSSSPSAADDVLKLLLNAIDRFPVESWRVQRSPVAMMTAWLELDEAPAGFTMDQDATLRATGESKASITYKRHALEPDDMRRHIKAGKQCVRLAMTWDSKISFVLTESLAIKSVNQLDVLTEKSDVTRNADERYDGDMTLMTGELAKMLAEVTEALGGDATVGEPGTDNAAPASPHAAAKAIHDLARADGATVTLSVNGKTVTSFGDGPDELYEKAVATVVSMQRASVSLVQRTFAISYNRAARLLETMESKGVVGPIESNGNRAILVPRTTDTKAA